MKKQIDKLTCDICHKNELVENLKKSKWIEISIESLYEDRCWSDAHICDSCIKLIQYAVENKSS